MSIYPNPGENKPAESLPPVESPSPAPIGGVSAEQYIAGELVRAKSNLNMTRIGGAIFLAVVGLYLFYVTSKFAQAMQPHDAATIAEGIINQQIEDKGPDLAAQLKQKIPEYIAQTPDYALQQLPKYRTTLEDRVENDLKNYCKTTSDQLGKHLDTYLDEHKDEIKAMLAAPNDPATMKNVGDSLRVELQKYLNEKPASGESLSAQIDKSLESLQEIGKKMRVLAANKNLSPEEKKTRRAIAILASSISNQSSLPRMPDPQ